MAKVWDERLWDTFNPHVYNFNKYNFDFLKNYLEFIQRRSKIEENYCKELRKLTKDFQPIGGTFKEGIHFSVQSAFGVALSELTSLADQRDQAAGRLRASGQRLRNELAELRKSATDTERRIAGLCPDLEAARKRQETARGLYHRAHAELAKTAEAEPAWEHRKHLCEQRRDAYAAELASFNALQKSHFHERLPEALNRLEMLLRNFCAVSRIGMAEWTKSEAACLESQGSRADAMTTAIGGVDPDRDATAFLSATASGRPLPGDLPFEEPPVVECRKFQRRASKDSAPLRKEKSIDEPNEAQMRRTEFDKMEKEIAGLRRLRDAYQANPALGDPAVVESQLHEALAAAGRLEDSLTGVVAAAAAGPAALADEFDEDEFDEKVDDNDKPENGTGADKVDCGGGGGGDSASSALLPPMSVMLYDFADSGQSSTLAVTRGERVRLLRSDPDWSLVSRLDGSESGFVPTAYVANSPPPE